MNVKYVVYGLFITNSEGKKEYFYVGKTRRSVASRVLEHKRRSKLDHFDVARFLRKLEEEGRTWDWEVLREVGPNEYCGDVEYREVVRLLGAGSNLRNMRYGDRVHRAELARREVDSIRIRTPEEISADRLAAEHRAAEQKVIARGRLWKPELLRLLGDVGIANVDECGLLSPVIRRRLAGWRIQRGISRATLVKQAREEPAMKKFMEKMMRLSRAAVGR